jgi:PleD family two-component response regulator
MLSAREGVEARIEGLHEGVDDYLIKPFSAANSSRASGRIWRWLDCGGRRSRRCKRVRSVFGN